MRLLEVDVAHTMNIKKEYMFIEYVTYQFIVLLRYIMT